ncbi:hypothetical protein BX600DRAFT_508223 [Xylariales sp. PMI_506]|nr:hypothetical protein BX600DRAFT_508223 [Xylariales sp. PMI_506]
MSDYLVAAIEAVLYRALKNGREFEGMNQIEAFFLENGIAIDFQAHSATIFDAFLRSSGQERRPRAPACHLPGYRAAAESDSVDGETDLNPSPEFTEEDGFAISIFKPYSEGFSAASARRCFGKMSFISTFTLEKLGLHVRDKRVLLQWHPMTKKRRRVLYTWCQVIDELHLGDCEVAIAEDVITQDLEPRVIEGEAGESQEGDGVADRSPIADMRNPQVGIFAHSGLDSDSLFEFVSYKEQLDFERSLARINAYSTMDLVRAKRGIANQNSTLRLPLACKRIRTDSSGMSEASLRGDEQA